MIRLAAWLLAAALVAGCRERSSQPPPAPADAAGAASAQDAGRTQLEAYRAAVRANPADGEARFVLARMLLDSGDWVGAAPEAIRAADLLPGHVEAQKLAISMLLGLQRFPEALERASRQRTAHPDDPALQILFGNASARLPNSWSAIERYDKDWRAGKRPDLEPARARSAAGDRLADEAFRRARTLAPDGHEATLALANLAWAQGRFADGETILRELAERSPADVLVNRALGLASATRGRQAEAEKYLRAATSTGDATSLTVLADYYVAQNRGADALAVFDVLASQSDPGGAAALNAARLAIRLGRPSEALSRVDRLLERSPNQPEALLIKAQILLQAGDAAQALPIAIAAKERAPMSAEARVTSARALLATGAETQAFDEFSEAWRLDHTDPAVARELAALALALDHPDEALIVAREAARLNPRDPAATMTLVRALLRTATSPRDLQAVERALAPLVGGSPSAEVLGLQGAIQHASGKRDAARSTYAAALRLDPGSLEALSGLVSLEIEEGRAAGVQAQVTRAADAHPGQPDYLVLAARVRAATGDLAGAERAARSALSIRPDHAPAATLLADLLARFDRADEARQVLQQAIARRPGSFDLQLAYADLLNRLGQIAEARTRYEALSGPTRQGAQASARLAALHARQGNLDLALRFASSAKQYLPADPVVNDTLGWVYVRKGVPSLGVSHLEEAVRADPDQAAYRYHLGVAYQVTGRAAQALEQLTRARDLDPRLPGVAEALAALPR